MRALRRSGLAVAVGVAISIVSSGATEAQPERQNGCAGPLHIMLTNDDGYAAAGIGAMRQALIAAGYRVTTVAPLVDQSGKGGSLTTGGRLAVKRQVDDGDNDVWSVAGTPVDSVRVGLSEVLANDPPDLVVSGSNFGQNTGRTVASSSGTVGAAYAATTFNGGFPAIDVSVEINLGEARTGFPSTLAAFPEAGAFTARLVRELQHDCRGGSLLPRFFQLHINYPARPAANIVGVEVTDLGTVASLDIGYTDPNGAIAAGEGNVFLAPVVTDPSQFEGDVLALSQGKIAIVVFDGDMTARPGPANKLREALKDLSP